MATIKTKSILEVLMNRSELLKIPLYQRNYNWGLENSQRLITDILEFGELHDNDSDAQYFLGSMVFKKITNPNDTLYNLVLVDGQQRITSILLILSAIKSIDPSLASKVNDYIFVEEDGQSKIKLSKIKKIDVLNKILNNNYENMDEDEKETNYYKNFIYIRKYLNNNKGKIKRLLNLMSDTSITWVQLSQKENENKVFETINSTGMPLTPSDLIKNHIFFKAINFSSEEEDKLINLYVEKVEPILIIKKKNEIDDFFRYFVTLKLDGALPKRGSREIYKMFISYVDKKEIELGSFSGVKTLINDIYKSALIYKMAKSKEDLINTVEDSKRKFFQLVLEKNFNTYFGMIYSMLDHYYFLNLENKLEEKKGSPKYFDILKLVVKYEIYRSINNKKDKNITRSVPKYFTNYCHNNEDISIHGFELYLQQLESNEQKMPKDNSISESLKIHGMYQINKTKTKNILLAAEIGSKTTTPYNQFDTKWTIEHILPQKWIEHWKKDMGEEIEKYIKYLHTPVNLTLLTHKLNPSVSNREFSFKKEEIQNDSRLNIDKMWYKYKEYDQELIDNRALKMADSIINLFK